jgi:hypothetical protein
MNAALDHLRRTTIFKRITTTERAADREYARRTFEGKILALSGDVSIPDRVLIQLAELTNSRDGDDFRAHCVGACMMATFEWRWHLPTLADASVRRSFRQISQASRYLWVMVQSLSDEARLKLFETATHFRRSDASIALPTVEDIVRKLISLEVAAGVCADGPKKRARTGAPFGVRAKGLESLVEGLRDAIEAEGGGRLTYDRPNKGGNLVEALKLLRPHLAEGLIPNSLPWRAMEKMTRRRGRKTSKCRATDARKVVAIPPAKTL